MLFTTPEIEEFISGVILYDETIRQSSREGVAFPRLLAAKGIIPGVKVDTGTTALSFAYGETITEGLDGTTWSGALHAGVDGWKRTFDCASSPLGLGMHGVRVDLLDRRAAGELNFTRFFPVDGRWEGTDHRVHLAPAP